MRAEHHQGAQPDVRVEVEGEHQAHGGAEQQVGRERGEELGDRLDRLAQRGRRPIQTPIGTQISVASAISTTTRISV